jgi:hypothetical protein
VVRNSRVFILGDLHFPFHHIDTFRFLKAIKKKYKPDRVISIGDETDQHSWSFHEHNPMLPSPEEELSLAKAEILKLKELFPEMDILESNHGSLVYRKQVASGLPRGVFKSYNDIYGIDNKWKWHRDLTIKMSNGSWLYLCHGKSADVLKTSQSMGMSVVQGHYHEKMSVQYWGNSLGLYFAAQTGCLVDDDSLAMEYNKTNLKRPLIGSLIVIDGHPRLIPMVLNKKGRWTGKVP